MRFNSNSDNNHGLICRNRWQRRRVTLLLAAGTNPKIVSERLGHSTLGITLNLHSHVTPDMQQEAATTLARALGPWNGAGVAHRGVSGGDAAVDGVRVSGGGGVSMT
jgi:hypothetical protein